MTTTTFDPTAAATRLLEAARTGQQIDALPDADRPTTIAQGYDLQEAVFAASGSRRGGWKVGVASPAQLRATGLARPLVGQLGAERCYPPRTQLQVPGTGPITIECEIAFVLARDLPPVAGRKIVPEDIRQTCVTFEIVRSRFADRRTVGWPSFIGDNVGFEALIVSEPVCIGLDTEIIRRVDDTATVFVDGEPRATALRGDAATDPLQSLAALIDHAVERGITLHAGDIITTGAMCEPFDVPGSGHALSVSFDGRTLQMSL